MDKSRSDVATGRRLEASMQRTFDFGSRPRRWQPASKLSGPLSTALTWSLPQAFPSGEASCPCSRSNLSSHSMEPTGSWPLADGAIQAKTADLRITFMIDSTRRTPLPLSMLIPSGLAASIKLRAPSQIRTICLIVIAHKHTGEDLGAEILLVAQPVGAPLQDADLVVEPLNEVEGDLVLRLAEAAMPSQRRSIMSAKRSKGLSRCHLRLLRQLSKKQWAQPSWR